VKPLLLALLIIFTSSCSSDDSEPDIKEDQPAGVGTDRLEEISGAMKEKKARPFSTWFSGEGEEEQKKEVELKKKEAQKKQEQAKKAKKTAPKKKAVTSGPVGCVQSKVYITDVENPEQYERLEDYPFTYECVTAR